MTAKTEWYEEILALDPASKVFWPFARHLVAQGQNERAIDVLRQGLKTYPFHAEARILLVHLINEQGKTELADQEAAVLAAALDAYPGIWDALARLKMPKNQEAGVLLKFLGQSARGRAASFFGVLDCGLATLGGRQGEFQRISPEQDTFLRDSAAEPSPGCMRPLAGAENPAEVGSKAERMQAPAAPAGSPDTSEAFPDDAVTLRTRSMAEILAEQGDIVGALAIYRELASQDPLDEGLIQRIAELESRGMQQTESDGGEPEESAVSGSGPEADSDEPHGMKWVLENLADRLDARAGKTTVCTGAAQSDGLNL